MHKQISEKLAFTYYDISVFLHFIGRCLYNLFLPIVLLKNGYTITQVLLFLLLSSIATIITSYIAYRLFLHKKVIYFNIIAILSELTLLILLSFDYFSLPIFILILLFETFYFSFYYLSHHAIIAHYTSKKQTANNLGNLTIASSFGSMMAPIAGALLLTKSKIQFILTATSFLIISLLPLFKIIHTDINGIKQPKIKIKVIKKDLIEYFFINYCEIIIFVFWAIYAYTLNMPLVNIGLITAASSFSSILFIYLIKQKLSDTTFKNKTIIISILGISIFSIYRYLFPTHIIFTNLAFGFLFASYSLALSTTIMNKLKKHQTYYSSMLLNMVAFSARTLATLTVFIIGLKNIILLPIITLPIYLIFLRK